MAEHCTSFNAHQFKPNICRNCFQDKQHHENSLTSNECMSSDVQMPASNETIDNNDQCQQNQADTNFSPIPVQTSSESKLPECKYGLACYQTNPDHFKLYSHSSGHERTEKSSERGDMTNPIVNSENTSLIKSTSSPANKRKLKLVKKFDEQKKSELSFIEFMENKIQELISQFELKADEVGKLRQDLDKMIIYNQQLKTALKTEIDQREQRQLKRKRVLAISRQTPFYWSLDSFEEPYREIEIPVQSVEYDIIEQLMNSTISKHGNRYGTVNGRDPTEFLINRIIRIENNELWHLYCFKKDMVIRQNNNRLTDCGSSIYLETRPLLTPLLDIKTNEYWLFHGCSQNNLYHLLHKGYDPRVSNLNGNFGGGFYLAENSSKSNKYIPCPGCNQNCVGSSIGCDCTDQENLEFSMILYRAALGDVHIALSYDKNKYCRGPNNQLIRRPPMKANGKDLYDSVMGESMKYGADRLQHREFVLYDSGQAYPEYVIYFRRSTKTLRRPRNIEHLKKTCREFLS
ncbi:unnamed protein product [Rotaria sp. Silwood1]|nr:unnamed protein product [Rotaria sp. Silwood1]